VILVQPSSVSVQLGQTASFGVQAVGESLTYQWQRNGVDIAGANDASFTINSVLPGDNGATFSVVVNGAGGSVASSTATLTIVPPGVGVTPTQIVSQPADVTVNLGQPATFAVGATGESLTYQWFRNGVAIDGATEASYTVASAAPTDLGALFRVSVAGAGGTVDSDAATLVVNQQAGGATATIKSPRQGVLYKAGQTIRYKGVATNAQGKKLPASAFSWRVDFHHDDHIHPFIQETPGKTGGSFKVPREGETSANVWFRINLTVTDPATGQTTETFRDVHPRTAEITVTTSQPGMTVQIDGPAVGAPVTFTAVVGMKRTLNVDATQVVDGVSYTFEKWSKGRKSTLDFIVPARNTTFEAFYQPTAAAG
jgi:hypothetical protein